MGVFSLIFVRTSTAFEVALCGVALPPLTRCQPSNGLSVRGPMKLDLDKEVTELAPELFVDFDCLLDGFFGRPNIFAVNNNDSSGASWTFRGRKRCFLRNP